MQNKKIQNRLQKEARRFHERVGAVVLLVATLLGVISISHESRNVLKQVALRPAVSIITNSGRENETARMPVRYDDVLKLQTTSGS